jgi:prevent-host-death family protein
MEITGEESLGQLVERVAHGDTRVVVEKSGHPVVAIISADEYERFQILDERDQAVRANFFETFARYSDAFADVPDDELERELAKAQAEVRAELRAEREASSLGDSGRS